MTNNVILIADDEPWQRMWMTQMLHTAGWTCSTVTDGSDVVGQALALQPTLLILDMEMPSVGGLEAAQQVRMLPKTQHIPILFVTSYTNGPALLKNTPFERAELLIKPFHPDELLRRVRRRLGADEAEQSAPTTSTGK